VEEEEDETDGSEDVHESLILEVECGRAIYRVPQISLPSPEEVM
jgi:hypothetical protein